jgi:hypothetical protein
VDLGMHPRVNTLAAILHQHVLVLLAVSHSTSCAWSPCAWCAHAASVRAVCRRPAVPPTALVFTLSASYTGCRGEMACRHQLLALLRRLRCFVGWIIIDV